MPTVLDNVETVPDKVERKPDERRLKSNVWLCIAILFGTALLTFTLQHMVLHPGHVVTGLVGDGSKNNLTYVYHSMWGHGFWFDGMNYPYGENIVYTDGQPVLSVPFTFLKNVTAEESLAAMWLVISFSYLLCFLFVYKILTHFEVAPFPAMLFAGLITVLSPQVFRLPEHYGLAYACIVPMLFYWTIRYNAQFRWRYPVYFFVAGCFMAFVHPYYVGLLLIWVTAYAIGYMLFSKKALSLQMRHISPLLLSVLLVAAVVAMVMKITDPISDRPSNPYNDFFSTVTHIKYLVTSDFSPLWLDANGKKRFRFVGETGPGFGYPGIIAVITVSISLTALLFRKVVRKQNTSMRAFSPIWLFMAFTTMLFSMGVPFIWHMQWLYDSMSFFRQFRVMGRFIWIFYYIISIYAVVVLYTVYAHYKAKQKLFVGGTILALSVLIWSYEASGYIKFTRKLSTEGMRNYDSIFSVGEQSWSGFMVEHRYTAASFQAVLVLPFFHNSTEKLQLTDATWLMTIGSKAALQLHLPIVDMMLARSSWSQAMKQVKIAAGPYVEKPLLREIKSSKPFLLLQYDDQPLDPDQQYLLQASDYIGHYYHSSVYACYPGRIAANDKRNADSIKRILPFMKQADTILANDGVVYMDHYDEGKAGPHVFGTGGGPVTHREDTVLATIPIALNHGNNALYEFSCWFLVGDKDPKMPSITLQLLSSNKDVIDSVTVDARTSTDNYRMWFRASKYFHMPASCHYLRRILINKPKDSYLGMDEMLLRPAGTLVISKSGDGRVMVNNHLFNAGGDRTEQR